MRTSANRVPWHCFLVFGIFSVSVFPLEDTYASVYESLCFCCCEMLDPRHYSTNARRWAHSNILIKHTETKSNHDLTNMEQIISLLRSDERTNGRANGPMGEQTVGLSDARRGAAQSKIWLISNWISRQSQRRNSRAPTSHIPLNHRCMLVFIAVTRRGE